MVQAYRFIGRDYDRDTQVLVKYSRYRPYRELFLQLEMFTSDRYLQKRQQSLKARLFIRIYPSIQSHPLFFGFSGSHHNPTSFVEAIGAEFFQLSEARESCALASTKPMAKRENCMATWGNQTTCDKCDKLGSDVEAAWVQFGAQWPQEESLKGFGGFAAWRDLPLGKVKKHDIVRLHWANTKSGMSSWRYPLL